MKIGLDIHGVIDANRPFFSELTNLLIDQNCKMRDRWLLQEDLSKKPNYHEIHIMTGPSWNKLKPDELDGIYYTHFFSIVDYCSEKGAKVTWADSSNPWIDVKLWNTAKAEYAAKHNLDLVIDDTQAYVEHFTTPIAIFQKKPKSLIIKS